MNTNFSFRCFCFLNSPAESGTALVGHCIRTVISQVQQTHWPSKRWRLSVITHNSNVVMNYYFFSGAMDVSGTAQLTEATWPACHARTRHMHSKGFPVWFMMWLHCCKQHCPQLTHWIPPPTLGVRIKNWCTPGHCPGWRSCHAAHTIALPKAKRCVHLYGCTSVADRAKQQKYCASGIKDMFKKFQKF